MKLSFVPGTNDSANQETDRKAGSPSSRQACSQSGSMEETGSPTGI